MNSDRKQLRSELVAAFFTDRARELPGGLSDEEDAIWLDLNKIAWQAASKYLTGAGTVTDLVVAMDDIDAFCDAYEA